MPKVMVERKELGRRLHILRWPTRLLDVQRATGIPQSTISRWERAVGKDYPPTDGLAILADFYKVSLDDLLDPEWDALAHRPNPGWLNVAIGGTAGYPAEEPALAVG